MSAHLTAMSRMTHVEPRPSNQRVGSSNLSGCALPKAILTVSSTHRFSRGDRGVTGCLLSARLIVAAVRRARRGVRGGDA